MLGKGRAIVRWAEALWAGEVVGTPENFVSHLVNSGRSWDHRGGGGTRRGCRRSEWREEHGCDACGAAGLGKRVLNVHGSESSSGLVIPPTPGGIGHSGLEVLERM